MKINAECPRCNGTGEVFGGTRNTRARYVRHDDLDPSDFGESCPKCDGSGSVDYDPEDEGALMTDIAQIAAGLTDAQRIMVRESEPDDVTGKEGCGVELVTGAQYATAKALERKGIGHREGPGGPFTGMYWNNADGLAVRAHLEKK